MTGDKNAAATKDDIRLLMDEIGKLYDANVQWKEELKEHFNVVAEQMSSDFRGAFGDKVQQHEERLQRVETVIGIRHD